ncbi:alpha/beta hydrolase [Magnetospirillum molischianum]|uniref:Putative esterase n=1 Tax=Magnetospirillum molischianum DSM 120 TaxID=1150626 RepID=H8FPU9_MAGML|nr:alpha/beta fold hydrolase [Magnetospirillum molischianum]CCG40387.1 putative esterase [Magnetospirillum molischianum DSM 120]
MTIQTCIPAAAEAALPHIGYTYHRGALDESGPAVLLIHGLAGTPNEMRSVARCLSASGFVVYAVRLAGHCGSEADLLKTGWRDWYGSVETVYADAAQRHQTVFVAGLCLGALLALHLAAQHKDNVAGLALYSLPLWYDGWSMPRLSFLLPWFLKTERGLSYRFVGSDPFSIKDERLRRPVAAAKMNGNTTAAGAIGISGRSLREMGEFVELLKPELPTINVPTLIVHAVEDDICGLRNPRYVARRLRGPVRTVLLGDCYHLITVDRQRAQVAGETAEFFGALAGVTPPRR